MRFEDYIRSLQETYNSYKTFESKELEIIHEEMKYVYKLANMLSAYSDTKQIGGEEGLLLYVFESKKEWISTEVYLLRGNCVAYQVYDEEKYRGFVRDAEILDGFVYMSLEKFMVHISLEKIFEFFMERPDYYVELAGKKHEENKRRALFLEKMKQML